YGLVERLARDTELFACALTLASTVHAIPAELLRVMKQTLGGTADLHWGHALKIESTAHPAWSMNPP
ncbi:MAG: hypothetical protein Q8N51_18830, partial [Gammaproteobacteria bacterium]|nr:hypothetical protein [Gammaproteobacteria bacterium]